MTERKPVELDPDLLKQAEPLLWMPTEPEAPVFAQLVIEIPEEPPPFPE